MSDEEAATKKPIPFTSTRRSKQAGCFVVTVLVSPNRLSLARLVTLIQSPMRFGLRIGGGQGLRKRSTSGLSVWRLLLWNKLATPQDTHDQEINSPSVPLRSTLGFDCAWDRQNKQQ